MAGLPHRSDAPADAADPAASDGFLTTLFTDHFERLGLPEGMRPTRKSEKLDVTGRVAGAAEERG